MYDKMYTNNGAPSAGTKSSFLAKFSTSVNLSLRASFGNIPKHLILFINKCFAFNYCLLTSVRGFFRDGADHDFSQLIFRRCRVNHSDYFVV